MGFLSSLLSDLNYGTIFFLMLLESTVLPVPSEFVITPAAYHAASGNLDIFLVVIFGILGAGCGATVNYLAGYYLGRPVIYRFANSRFGHLCLLNQSKIERSERYFNKHGMAATITGRLIPGIRHLISIPAGMSKMKYWKFLLYTMAGAGVWNCVLAVLGWYLHSIVPEDQLDDKIALYTESIKSVIFVLVGIGCLYLIIRWLIKRHKRITGAE
ncbi:MAG: DedA family protein [Prevotella sp.]|jgi:membrane protein DedA with SNARE-associated domain|nr:MULTISPECIES: DedA family protein [unclassified Prevotella]MCH3969162.1 DedA family protein [Prevotella sp.]MCH3985815.1 DedA family protein [Prevotella sp.]MCH3991991.1 DedA family protein [Prevotella sp.]MCH4017439.1 DedA family protein [Prevotella sp.]MCH4186098.1 DedA family protein [Prevotella sp.]